MTINDHSWWFISIYGKPWPFVSIHKDSWWFMITQNNWWQVIKRHVNSLQFMTIYDILWLFMTIYDHLWQFRKIYMKMWRRLGKTSKKKRISFGHCPKVALTPPLILDTHEVTFVSAHFGQPWGNFCKGPKFEYLLNIQAKSASKLLEPGHPQQMLTQRQPSAGAGMRSPKKPELYLSLMYSSAGLIQRNVPHIEWSLGNQYCCLYTHHNMMAIYIRHIQSSEHSMVQKIGL